MYQLKLILVFMLSTVLIGDGQKSKCQLHPKPLSWSGGEKFNFYQARENCERNKGQIPSFHSQSDLELLLSEARSVEVDLPFFVIEVQTNKPSMQNRSDAINLQHRNRTNCYIVDPKNANLTPCENSGKATLLCFLTKRPYICGPSAHGWNPKENKGATLNPPQSFFITTFVLSICLLKIFHFRHF